MLRNRASLRNKKQPISLQIYLKESPIRDYKLIKMDKTRSQAIPGNDKSIKHYTKPPSYLYLGGTISLTFN